MGQILVQSASFSQRFGSPPTFPPKRSWSIYRSDLNNIILLVSQNSWFNWKKHNPDQQINQLEDIPYKELELKNYSSRINKLKKHTTPWKIQWISRWSGQRSGVLPPILPVPSPPGSPSSALAMKQGGWRQLPSVYITLLATNMSPPSRHFWVWWTSKSGRWTNRSLEGCNLLLLVSATRPSIISLQNVTQNCKNQIWFPKKTNNLTFFKIRCSLYKTLVQPFSFSLLDAPWFVRCGSWNYGPHLVGPRNFDGGLDRCRTTDTTGRFGDVRGQGGWVGRDRLLFYIENRETWMNSPNHTT